jgi:PAS domain S-box-containing protein
MTMGIRSFRRSRALPILTWALALFGLYLISLYSYLLFHSLAELFSIVVAFGIFVIFWNARRMVDNSYFLFLGISYLFIAVLDVVHTLAYPGMNIFPGADTNLPTQLWIAARYLQGISLLIAPVLLGRRLRGTWVAVGYGLGTGLILGAILRGGMFPACFVEGQGLTPFKIISEYVISLSFVASLAMLYRKRQDFDRGVLYLLMASTVVAIASELAFTRYANAYAPANLIGHLLKIVSFYLVYRAVVVTSLVRPYDLLFRDLKKEQDALRESEDRYRHLVEDIDDVIYSVDAEGIVTYVSPAIESMLGYESSEIVGRDFNTLVHPDDLRAARRGLQAVLSGETNRVNEYRVLTKSGGLRSVRVSSRPVRVDGQVVNIRGALTDTTEQTRAEEALREYADDSAARARQLNCLYGMSALVETSGLTLEQVLQGIVELIPPACEYPELTCARLSIQAEEFQTGNYLETAWHHTSEIEVGGARCGSLQVCYLEQRPSSDEVPFRHGERDLIEAVAERVGRIIERVRASQMLVEAKEAAEAAEGAAEERRREAERRREVAESLADVMKVLNSNRPLGEVLDYITSQARRVLGNDAAAIYRVNGEGRWSVQAADGSIPHPYDVEHEDILGPEVLEEAIATGEPVAMYNRGGHTFGRSASPEDAGGQHLARATVAPYQALLTLPLTSGDEPYGVISLYYVDPIEFTEDRAELAALFADQVGLAIENAGLRDQLQETAAVAERERLAGDLHDAVTQTLFSASLIAETLPRIWERDRGRGEEGLEELRELTQGALAEMRTLLMELRPASLVEKPLGELLSQLVTAVASRSRVPVRLTVRGDDCLLPDMQVGLYRIAQEALNNMVKHAQAREAFVDLHCEPGWVTLSIRDDGRGFDLADIMPTHLGLAIMRERAERMGASLEISSEVGEGTFVAVNWKESGERHYHD